MGATLVKTRDPHDPFDAKAIEAMRGDQAMMAAARTFLGKTFEYGYYRNFTWLGRPIIQYPQDVLALQELIWDYRPTLVVETGVAHGGALILYASILELIGGPGEVIGVEVDFRSHNKQALADHPLSRRIDVVEGSSIDAGVIDRVKQRAKDHDRIMVILDSLHTHDHVLEELRVYSPLVKKGGPLVVFGTSVAEIDREIDLKREWNQDQNPKTALDAFLRENGRFEVDHEINDKLLITDAPSGYLRCTRD
jgi:cephalosporin hydroxylase